MSELGNNVPDYPILNNYTASIRRKAKEIGDPRFQSLWTGQAGSAARDGKARDVFDQIVRELDAAVGSLSTPGDLPMGARRRAR